MSRSIGEPLADCSAKRAIGALHVVDAKPYPVAVAEIELSKITVKMFLANVLIDSINPALQDREIVLGGIGGSVAAHVFLLRMVHGAVTGELLASFPVHAAFIGSQVRGFVDFGFQDWPQVRCIDFRDRVRADSPLALDQSDDSFFRSWGLIGAISGATADESFIAFDELTFAAERPSVIKPQIDHRFA